MNAFLDNWLLRRAMSAPRGSKEYIQFADPAVEAICVANWSSDGIGVTYEDAAAVTSITNVFKGNTTITSFNELKYFTGMPSLSAQAFRSCTGLIFASVVNETIEYSAFQSSGLKSITLLDGVKVLGPNVFNGASYLEELTLPSTVTNIGGGCFANTRALTVLVSKPTVPPTIGGAQAFAGTNANLRIYVPYSADHSILAAYQTASYWSDVASKIYELNPDGTIPS